MRRTRDSGLVRSPLERLGLGQPPSPSLPQIMDALILYDAPMLDQRFQEAIAMHPDGHARRLLEALPPRVAEGSRLTRRAGVEWDRVTRGGLIDDAFRTRAERFLLETFLYAGEEQIRLKSLMARHAPTREVRALIDDAILIHRELTDTLRKAIVALDDAPAQAPRDRDAGFVGPADPEGDLRQEVEDAIRAMVAKGGKPRVLVLSSNALRHLRDQGLFADEETTVLDVPVQVDMTWPGLRFALLSFDAVALEEIVRGQP